MANTKKAPGKERSTAEVEAAVKEMETQSVKDSTKEAAAGEKDSAKKNTVKKGSMKKRPPMQKRQNWVQMQPIKPKKTPPKSNRS